MPTTNTYLKYANLQMAAEAFLVNDSGEPLSGQDLLTALKNGNGHASKFTATQAQEFIDPNKGWTVVDQCANTKTGFSGTLFENKATGDLVVSFRSTEFVDDAVRDSVATNTQEIFNTGFAWGQIADMEAWYAKLSGQGGALQGKQFSVTGYSLGGHLATAFHLLRAEQGQAGRISEVVTFNGAGVGKITQGRLSDALATFNQQRSSPEAIKQALAIGLPEVAAFYDNARQRLASGAWKAQDAKDALVALAVDPGNADPATWSAIVDAEKRPFLIALDEIIAQQVEAKRITGFVSGGTESTALKNVPLPEMLAQSLDYRLAVGLAAKNSKSAWLIQGAWQAVSSKSYGNPRFNNQWDVVGTETTSSPWSAVANSQWHHGQDVKLFIEDQPTMRGDMAISDFLSGQFLKQNYDLNNFSDTHSLALLVDSLSVQNALLQLVPADQQKDAAKLLDSVLKAASWAKAKTVSGAQGEAEGDVLENVVNALSDLILGPHQTPLTGRLEGNTWHLSAEREALYARLKSIQERVNNGLLGRLSLTAISSTLAGDARTDFASFVALYSLSPLAFKAASPADAEQINTALAANWNDYYSDWDKDRQAVAAGDHGVAFSDEWLDDRANFLQRKAWFNTQNLNPVNAAYQYEGVDHVYLTDSTYFKDFASGYEIAQGFSPASPYDGIHHYLFGDAHANELSGRGVEDHLYGGGGDDNLVGQAGDDLLAGDSGNDTLDGGDDDDTLIGGQGDDILRGGEGFDTYRYRPGDGKDTIIETREGDRVGGRIVIERGPEIEMLAELLVKQGDQNLWSSADGSITLSHNSPWTLAFADGSSIQLGENQDDFESGDFGLRLYEEKAAPTAFDRAILGDLQPVDFDPVKDGIQTRTDELGNVIVAPDKLEPDRVDVLYDSAGNDEIKGLGGDDSIIAWCGGLDRIDAGDGDDFVWGGAGGDTVIGGTGADILNGGVDNDRIFGESETTLDAALAQQDDPGSGLTGDLLNGVAGNDTLIGATGNDFLAGGVDDDLMIGGAGDDNFYGDNRGVSAALDWTATRSVTTSGNTTLYKLITNFYYVVASDGGNDVIYAGGGDDWLFANRGDDYCDGGTGNDVLFGELGNDDLFGGEGDDSINGDSINFAESLHGDDYLDGEAGNDRLFGQGGDDFLFGGTGTDMLAGHAGDDYLDGEGDADRLFGGEGDDQLFGGDGNDMLQGDFADVAGDDTLDGEAGDDQLLGMGGRDEIYGGEGADQIAGDNGGTDTSGEADTIYGGAGNDRIDAQGGDDFVDAGDDNDIVAGRAGNDQLAGGAGNDQLQGGEGDDTLDGGDGGDKLFGEASNDTLLGGDGDDYLIGGLGDDILDGGAGDDVYYYAMGEGNDHIVDSGGTDWLVFNDISLAGITLGIGSLKLSVPGGELHLDDFDPDNPYGAGGIEYFAFADGSAMSKAQLINALGFKPIGTPEDDVLSGTALNDTITALAGNDVVNARAGNDTIYLDAGDDFADAGAGNDSVYGGEGADQVFGGEGGDTIYGGIGDDVLFGDAGNDQVFGDAGNDVLSGGAGSDQLDGGDGDDIFIFARGDGADVVADGAGNNQVQLGSGLNADDVVLTRQDSDLVIAVKNTNDRLTVRNWFAADNHFAGLTLGDGTPLDHAGVEALMPTNQAPLLTADAGTVIEDSRLAVSGNVLSNDADPEGRSLRVSNAGTYAGAVGSLSLGSTGAFAYTLANGSGAVQSLAAGQVLSESFAYTASDDDPNGAASAESMIVIAVQGANDLPILGADSAATSEDATAPLTGNVLTNDRDIDQGTTLAVSDPGTRVGSYGTLTLAVDGAYGYQVNTPSVAVQSLAAGQAVTDRFAQSISDGVAVVAGSLAITINGQNDAPIVTTPLSDQLVSPNTSWTWQLPAGSFADVDAGDVLTYSASLADGSVLPSWLSFSAETQTFSGRAPKSASGSIEIGVGVADRQGATARRRPTASR